MVVFRLRDGLIERDVQTVECFRLVDVERRSVRQEGVLRHRRRRLSGVRLRCFIVANDLNGYVR